MKKDPTEIPFIDEIKKARQLIREGACILYPSDSLWGIGCDASNTEAAQRIYEIKARPPEKKFIVLVADDAMLQRVVKNVPALAWDLIDNSTEPLTIIYDEAKDAFRHLAATNGSIAVRIPQEGFCRSFVRYCGIPLVSTSANRSGKPSPLTFDQVDAEILESLDYVFPEECGLEMTGEASHILSLKEDGSIKVYR